jgi:hypothetical protein
MKKILKLLTISSIFILFLSTTFCLADMTIWLRDGSSKQVRKIVFKGKVAELHLTNGTMAVLPVDKLDLESSGIGAPEGTYGETTLSPFNKRTGVAGTKGVTPGGGLKQSELLEQWDDSNAVAIAQKDIGAIRNGQTVKIVRRPAPDRAPSPAEYKTYEYETTPQTDEAYVIIYKNPDGTLAKKLFDAATFASAFKIIEPKSASATAEIPTLPPENRPTQVLSEGTPENSLEHEIQPDTRMGEEPPREQSGIQKSEEPPPVILHRRNRRDLAIPPGRPFRRLIGGAIVAVVLIGAAILLFKKKRPSVFINTSRFRKYEEELREFEIELWMKHGKTAEQLLEICVKKFYQDSPPALPVALKMIKTTDRSSIIPLIVKQSGRGPSDVENIYAEMKVRMESIRQLIRDTQQRFSKKILSSVSQTVPPITTPSSPSTQVKPQVAGARSPVVLDPVVPPKKQIAEVSSASSRSEELPPYFVNILNQLCLLTRE